MAAAPDQYTHRISFKVADGGKFIVANVKFDEAGKPDVDIINSSKPLTLSLIEDLRKVVDLVGQISVSAGGVKNISIRERGYSDPDAKRK